MKKSLRTIVTLFLLTLVFVFSYNFASGASLEGQGTAENPYLIESSADLELFSNYINDSPETKEHFKLTTNINHEKKWTPIEFGGVFDGNGYSIELDTLVGEGDFGFFNKLSEGGLVKDLTVLGDIKIENSSENTLLDVNVGVTVALNFGKVENVVFSGAIIIDKEIESLTLGGLVGKNYGEIIDSINEGSINILDGFVNNVIVGGISGESSSSSSRISFSKNSSKIKAYSKSKLTLGGLIGVVSERASIKDLENHGDIIAVIDISAISDIALNVGGIVGVAENVVLENIVNYGMINSSYLGRDVDRVINYAGGLVGKLNNRAVIRNSSNKGDVIVENGYLSIGAGIAGDATNGIIYNSFNIGEVKSTSTSVRHRTSAVGIASGQAIVENTYNIGLTLVRQGASEEKLGSGLFDLTFNQSSDKLMYNYWLGENKAVTDSRRLLKSSQIADAYTLADPVIINGQSYSSLVNALNAWVRAFGQNYDTWAIEDDIVTFGEVSETVFERKEISFSIGEDLDYGTPVLVNGTTMVPVRFVEDLGVHFEWLSQQRKVIYRYLDKRVEISIGQETALANNNELNMPQRAYINEQNRTMVPLRMISEELGFHVKWISNAQPITIIKETKIINE